MKSTPKPDKTRNERQQRRRERVQQWLHDHGFKSAEGLIGALMRGEYTITRQVQHTEEYTKAYLRAYLPEKPPKPPTDPQIKQIEQELADRRNKTAGLDALKGKS